MEKFMTGQEESRRFASEYKREELHWQKGCLVNCCAQWMYICWRPQEQP